MTDTVTLLQSAYAENKANALSLMDGLTDLLKNHSEEGEDILSMLRAEGDLNIPGFPCYLAAAGFNRLEGSTDNDILLGGGGNDLLDGGDGNDSLSGGSGDDILIGGLGNDTLDGGAGSDRYLFAVEDGTDTISDYDPSTAYSDTVVFGEGIVASAFALSKRGNDLQVRLNENDSLILKNWFASMQYRIERFEFADGTVLNASQFENLGPITVEGSEGNDTLGGSSTTATADIINGYGGNDTLNGYAGDDLLNGGEGNDTLSGGTGNDTLVGGLGNDTLTGGAGNDIFVFDTALNATTNKDSVTDFVVGQDKIQLDRDIFTVLTDEGALAADSFLASAAGTAADDNDYFLYNTSSGALFYDADGSGEGVAVQFATLTTKPKITANDFLVAA